MTSWWMLPMMIAIGALIGGLTNSLAIKMLFRPHRAIYVKKWRLPFTPGLIPKRKHELAFQLGTMVMNHLLTEKGLKAKLQDSQFKEDMIIWTKSEVSSFLHKKESIAQLIKDKWDIEASQIIERKTEQLIKENIQQFLLTNQEKTLEQMLPEELLKKGDSFIEQGSDFIIRHSVQYFKSAEGKKELQRLVDRFLRRKGTVIQMLRMMIGQDRLVEKLQTEIDLFLQQQETKQFIDHWLEREWSRLKSIPLHRWTINISTSKVAHEVATWLRNDYDMFRFIHVPMHDWSKPFHDEIVHRWLPKVVHEAGVLLTDRMADILERLNLAEVIKREVENFSIERLEAIVLSISRREFRMITLLGALIGGVVGFIQGLLVAITGM